MAKSRPNKRKLKKKAWTLLSKVKRYVDWLEPDGKITCYTCGVRKPPEEMQAGHLLDGRGNSILFKELALKPQCVGCNMFKSGNKEVYIPKFIDQYGRTVYDTLCKLKRKTLKLGTSELDELIESYKIRLEKGEQC